MTRLQPSLLYAFIALQPLVACDNREAFKRPEPGLERMLMQPRGYPYAADSFFEDGRMMRPPPPGTVAREQPEFGQILVETGRNGGDYAQSIPVPVTRAALERGRAEFERMCATCHGILGDGNSVVAQKMELRKPPSFFEARLIELPPGKIFEVASKGYGFMPGYAQFIDVNDRWAVVAYIEALRLSQTAKVATLPKDVQTELNKGAP